MAHQHFRAAVGVLVVDGEGHVLACERADVPGSWQLPQGGLHEDEPPVEAAARELREESGLPWDAVTLLAEHPDWLAYELPAAARSRRTGRGQVLRWFLVRYDGDADAIDLSDAHEFRTYRWMPMADLIEATWEVRRPVYRRLHEAWSDYLA